MPGHPGWALSVWGWDLIGMCSRWQFAGNVVSLRTEEVYREAYPWIYPTHSPLHPNTISASDPIPASSKFALVLEAAVSSGVSSALVPPFCSEYRSH